MDQHDRDEEIQDNVEKTVEKVKQIDARHASQIDDNGVIRRLKRNLFYSKNKHEKKKVWRDIERDRLSRRDFLKLLGVGAGGIASFGFGTLLGRNLADVGGVNPYTGKATGGGATGKTGTTAHDLIDLNPDSLDAVNFSGGNLSGAINSLGSGQKLVVPKGTYNMSGINLSGSNKAVVGEPGAKIVMGSSNFNVNGNKVLFEGFTLDQTRINGIQGRFDGSGWAIRDIRYEGAITGGGIIINIGPKVQSGGVGVAENVQMPYGSSKPCNKHKGIWAGKYASGGYSNRGGEIYFRNCWVQKMGENTAYTRHGKGPFYYQGGLYRNSNVGIRIGTTGTRVQGVHVVSNGDFPAQGGSAGGSGCGKTQRGVWLQQPFNDIVIEDCSFYMDNPHGSFGIGTHDDSNQTIEAIRNCRFTMNNNSPAIVLKTTGGPVTVENCHITGSSSATAVIIQKRSGSVVRDCCISTNGKAVQGTARTENIKRGSCKSADVCNGSNCSELVGGGSRFGEGPGGGGTGGGGSGGGTPGGGKPGSSTNFC